VAGEDQLDFGAAQRLEEIEIFFPWDAEDTYSTPSASSDFTNRSDAFIESLA
jgi:hypothetical protein